MKNLKKYSIISTFFAHFAPFGLFLANLLTLQQIIMAQNQLSAPNYMKKVSFHKLLFIKLAKQVIQTRNFGILFLFFQLFAHFGLFTDPLTNCKVQKSIQLPKLHGKSVISLNKFHIIWENSTKIVKKWPKTTYGLY